ncbi:anti-sigma factor [Niabella ginsenosidivorans]|uniref:Anti-sigma factor n=1 Tax=Niabella ginsenosidivorans TaxID=1176587 RepID=A0A1A9I095_9BACT|nr:anti-sigma factor [Niabella ginsenosidivorans]ANH79974.1 anti-sigma factor [Niabella ginsenosidivorans]
MSNKLEDFIRKNKEAFDDHEPSAALWKRLEKKIQATEEPAPAKVVPVNWWKWAAAAMIIITAGVLSRPYWKPAAPSSGPVAKTTLKDTDTVTPNGTDTNTLSGEEHFLARGKDEPDPSAQNNQKKDRTNPENTSPQGTINEELFHYARLIEIKQKEIATLKNHHPELFKQFSQDLTALNKSYGALKQQYDEGLNSEQLLNAMIDNLKMQTELLNKQLEITKKLKQQNGNDKTYKII